MKPLHFAIFAILCRSVSKKALVVKIRSLAKGRGGFHSRRFSMPERKIYDNFRMWQEKRHIASGFICLESTLLHKLPYVLLGANVLIYTH